MPSRYNNEKSLGAGLAAVLPSDGDPWYKKWPLVRLNFCLLCMFFYSSANGYDGSMMNGLQALPQWQHFMHHPTGAWLGFVNAVQSIFSFCLFPIVAWGNNRFGRKKTIAVGYIWLAIGVALQAAAKGPTMFILGRLFIGGVGSFFTASAPLLVTEVAYPTHRGTLTAMFNCGWYVGSLIAAWATFGTRNYSGSWAWRIPSILQCCIPAFSFIGYVMVPESLRWLVSQDRIEEAREILIYYHADGDSDSRLVEFELQEIMSALATEAHHANSSSWAGMFSTRANWHRSLITICCGIFSQWNGVGIVSYYLAPVLNTVGVTSTTNQTMISGFLQLWNLIFAVGSTLTVDHLGRRKLFLISCSGMLASYIAISALAGTFAKTNEAATGIAVVPFLFVYYAFYDIAFTPLTVAYTCEIWNYNFRARGIALYQISTSLAVFFNIFVNPIALDAIAWKYYIIYCCIIACIGIVIWFLFPETLGHSLEEMTRIFDGHSADKLEPLADAKLAESEITHIVDA